MTRPTPTAILRQRGTWRADRHANALELRTPDTRPRMPTWLSADAKRHWRRLAPKLHDVGLLHNVDVLTLGMLVEALAQYEQARALVREHGMIAHSERGGVYQHPAVGIMNRSRAAVLKHAREFGMTPSARRGLQGDAPDAGPTLADQLFAMVNDMGGDP